MKKYTITRIWKGIKETKFGNKPTVRLQVMEHGDTWLSTFKVTPAMDNWKEGDAVELNVSEKNGYLNFDTQSNPQSELADRVAKLEQAVFGNKVAEKVVDISEQASEKVDDFDF